MSPAFRGTPPVVRPGEEGAGPRESMPTAGAATGGQARETSFDAVLRLPARPESVVAARRVTRCLLPHWTVPAQACEDAELIVSELAGNAVRHGRAEMTVALVRRGPEVEIIVHDFGPCRADRRMPESQAEQEYGRGLVIVQAVADRTQVIRDQAGWRVSAAVSADAPKVSGS